MAFTTINLFSSIITINPSFFSCFNRLRVYNSSRWFYVSSFNFTQLRWRNRPLEAIAIRYEFFAIPLYAPSVRNMNIPFAMQVNREASFAMSSLHAICKKSHLLLRAYLLHAFFHAFAYILLESLVLSNSIRYRKRLWDKVFDSWHPIQI